MKKINLRWVSFLIFTLCLLSIVTSNLIRSFNFGINPNDFTIYQQAIYDLAGTDSWNPFISIRGLKIFNDHFDPIIVVAAGFLKIFGTTPQALLIFEWLVYLSLFGLWYRLGQFKSLFDEKFLLGCSVLLFSRSLQQGVEFPIHPTTWSMLPLFGMGYFLSKRKYLPVYLIAFFLCWFRESLPFALIGLSGYFLINRNWKHFLGFFGLGVSGAAIALVIRPKLLGPTVNYGNSLVKSLLNEHFFYVWERIQIFNFDAKVFVVPFFLLLLVLYKETKKWQEVISHPMLAALFIGFPLFFVHMLKNYLAHHHSIPMVTTIIAVFLFSKTFRELQLKSRLASFLVFLCIFTSSSRFTRYFKMIFSQKSYASAQKKTDYKKVKQLLTEVPLKASLIATGGVVADILKPGMNLYQFDANTPVLEKGWEYLLLELKEPGDLIPIGPGDVRRIYSRCYPEATKILFESPYFLLAKGPFLDSCIGLEKKWPGRSIMLPKN